MYEPCAALAMVCSVAMSKEHQEQTIVMLLNLANNEDVLC